MQNLFRCPRSLLKYKSQFNNLSLSDILSHSNEVSKEKNYIPSILSSPTGTTSSVSVSFYHFRMNCRSGSWMSRTPCWYITERMLSGYFEAIISGTIHTIAIAITTIRVST